MDNRPASTAILKHSTGKGLLLKSDPFRLYRLMAAGLTGLSFILTRFRIAPSVFSTILDKGLLYVQRQTGRPCIDDLLTRGCS
jgi:hypothetical protein